MTPKEDLIDWINNNIDSVLQIELDITKRELLDYNEVPESLALDQTLEELKNRIKIGLLNVVGTYREDKPNDKNIQN